MKVELIGITKTVGAAIESKMDTSSENAATDTLAEFAGRTCYLSYHKPNSATRSNADYLANILKQGHESVLEHSSASFYVEGVSRNLLIELERHRFLSFSVVSTRYVDANKLNTVIPPAFGGGVHAVEGRDWFDYNYAFKTLRDQGKTFKQAREAAAYYLPGGLETRFVVSGNFRAWRDVVGKRISPQANAEIKMLAEKVLSILVSQSPNSFQDLKGLLDE
jgi:thymidylate synthase (FAD)